MCWWCAAVLPPVGSGYASFGVMGAECTDFVLPVGAGSHFGSHAWTAAWTPCFMIWGLLVGLSCCCQTTVSGCPHLFRCAVFGTRCRTAAAVALRWLAFRGVGRPFLLRLCLWAWAVRIIQLSCVWPAGGGHALLKATKVLLTLHVGSW